MPSDFDDVESSVRTEPIERRREPRGLMRDLFVTLDAGGRRQALEASRKGFFVDVDDPDYWQLGQALEITVERDEHAARCRVEVIRKEIDPRRGVALRIAHITPLDEQRLVQILGEDVAGSTR